MIISMNSVKLLKEGIQTVNKKCFLLLVFVLIASFVFASNITFSGGYTKVSLQDGNHSVMLTDGAYVNTDEFSLSANSIQLFGTDYDMVQCDGNVVVVEIEKELELKCPKLVYDRTAQELMANGWIEIDDKQNELKLSCAWLDYKQSEKIMLLQIRAKIVKNTDDGLMNCTANSIEYNSETQIVKLKGNARVEWGDDIYNASIITVNLDTEEVTLHGSISGEVNGQ